MEFFKRVWTELRLKRLINAVIKANVNPVKQQQTLHLNLNGLKLKIVSERNPGKQIIYVLLDHHYKIKLSKSEGRRSTKKLFTKLNKKVRYEFEPIIEALTTNKKYEPFTCFQRITCR